LRISSAVTVIKSLQCKWLAFGLYCSGFSRGQPWSALVSTATLGVGWQLVGVERFSRLFVGGMVFGTGYIIATQKLRLVRLFL
jgi:hypothetical protein